jgi:RimJ/RimL family protein N-acetyltransferase
MMLGHWELRAFGLWAVERKSDGAFVGRVGLLQPDGWPGTEVAWTLGREYWGQGYATEAAKACLNYGFQNCSVSKLISMIDAENHASQRVAQRLGYARNGGVTFVVFGKSYSAELWEISRERWLAN